MEQWQTHLLSKFIKILKFFNNPIPSVNFRNSESSFLNAEVLLGHIFSHDQSSCAQFLSKSRPKKAVATQLWWGRGKWRSWRRYKNHLIYVWVTSLYEIMYKIIVKDPIRAKSYSSLQKFVDPQVHEVCYVCYKNQIKFVTGYCSRRKISINIVNYSRMGKRCRGETRDWITLG